MDDRSGWRLLDDFGVRQHGHVHARQAQAAGVPEASFRRYAAQEAGDRPHLGVVRLLGAPRTPHGQIMAALLAAGAPVLPWGWTAAWLWGLVSALPTTVHLLVPETRRAPALDRVRGTRCRRFTRITWQVVAGVPVPDPGFALCGVAGLADLPRLRALVIDARQRRLVSLGDIAACCDTLTPLKGLAGLRRVLWQLDESRCDSVLEWELRKKLRAAGFRPDAHPAAVDTGARPLHVDIPWSRQRVGIEVDGFGSHSSRASLNKDIRRHNRMQRTDWRILHAGWAQLDAEFDQFAEDLAWLLSQRS